VRDRGLLSRTFTPPTAETRVPILTPLGELANDFFEWFGSLGIFAWNVARSACAPPFEGRELVRQLDEIGSKSLPLVALAGSAIGVVLAMQARQSLTQFGAKSLFPSAIVYSVVQEMGPIITGLVVSGRVGAGIGAELASMKVSEQIDALEVSAVSPYRFLAAPRILACILMMPLLTIAADFCALLMGWFANALVEPMSLHRFMESGFNGDPEHFPASYLKNRGLRTDCGIDFVFPGHDHDGRRRRRRTRRDQISSAGFLVRNPC